MNLSGVIQKKNATYGQSDFFLHWMPEPVECFWFSKCFKKRGAESIILYFFQIKLKLN